MHSSKRRLGLPVLFSACYSLLGYFCLLKRNSLWLKIQIHLFHSFLYLKNLIGLNYRKSFPLRNFRRNASWMNHFAFALKYQFYYLKQCYLLIFYIFRLFVRWLLDIWRLKYRLPGKLDNMCKKVEMELFLFSECLSIFKS